MKLAGHNGLDEQGGRGRRREDEEVAQGELLGGSGLGEMRHSSAPVLRHNQHLALHSTSTGGKK